MSDVSEIDRIADVERLLAIARAADVLSLKCGDVEFVLQPQLRVAVSEADAEDLGLPPDPGDPSLDATSPYVPPNTKQTKPKRSKVQRTDDGEVIVDPANPLNPDNPVDFARDFPQGPEVPGYPSR
jgi:hypothetical protein